MVSVLACSRFGRGAGSRRHCWERRYSIGQTAAVDSTGVYVVAGGFTLRATNVIVYQQTAHSYLPIMDLSRMGTTFQAYTKAAASSWNPSEVNAGRHTARVRTDTCGY